MTAFEVRSDVDESLPASWAAVHEARIARWEHLTFSSEERKVQEGVALMRSLLARAVKAEADLAKQTHRENEGVMIFDGIVADLRAKLAAAEKARDAALAAQNAKAMEELECLGDRGARWEWMPAGYQREIQLRLAALRSSPPAAPAADHNTANVCGIRRKSDGYWWQCDGEHGAGWNDKRIRQAWTMRGAHAHIADMRSKGMLLDDVEVVELAPVARAGEAPAGDDDTLRRFLRRDDAHRGGELLLSVVADLCRRELARGER